MASTTEQYQRAIEDYLLQQQQEKIKTVRNRRQLVNLKNEIKAEQQERLPRRFGFVSTRRKKSPNVGLPMPGAPRNQFVGGGQFDFIAPPGGVQATGKVLPRGKVGGIPTREGRSRVTQEKGKIKTKSKDKVEKFKTPKRELGEGLQEFQERVSEEKQEFKQRQAETKLIGKASLKERLVLKMWDNLKEEEKKKFLGLSVGKQLSSKERRFEKAYKRLSDQERDKVDRITLGLEPKARRSRKLSAEGDSKLLELQRGMANSISSLRSNLILLTDEEKEEVNKTINSLQNSLKSVENELLQRNIDTENNKIDTTKNDEITSPFPKIVSERIGGFKTNNIETFSPEQEQIIQDNMKAHNRSREEVIFALKQRGIIK